MSAADKPPPATRSLRELHSELLILPDGRIFVHNLTRTMAALLQEFNPDDDAIRPRAESQIRISERPPLVA